jgi:hypothetical protein
MYICVLVLFWMNTESQQIFISTSFHPNKVFVLNLSRKHCHKVKTLLPYFFNKLIRLGSFESKISTKVLEIVVCYVNVLCNGTTCTAKCGRKQTHIAYASFSDEGIFFVLLSLHLIIFPVSGSCVLFYSISYLCIH